MSEFITNTEIDALVAGDVELNVRVAEAVGARPLPPDGDWRHAHPRWWRDRLRQLLFPPGPGTTAFCEEYDTNIDLATVAAQSVGADVSGTDPAEICRQILRHCLASSDSQ